MTGAATRDAGAKPRPWRIVLFTIVNGLVALLFLGLFGGAITLLEPWGVRLSPDQPGYTPEIHRWHQGQWAAQMGILLGGTLVALLWRPYAKPLLMQFFGLGMAGFLFVLALAPHWGPKPAMLTITAIIVSLVIAAYPRPRALLETTRERPVSRPLLALSALAAALLAPASWQAWQLQVVGGSEHAEHHAWASGVVLALLLVLAGALAATKRPGWQALGALTGVAFLYLGTVALTVPDQPGSWGSIGGVLSLLGGLAFITATLLEARMTATVAATGAAVAPAR